MLKVIVLLVTTSLASFAFALRGPENDVLQFIPGQENNASKQLAAAAASADSRKQAATKSPIKKTSVKKSTTKKKVVKKKSAKQIIATSKVEKTNSFVKKRQVTHKKKTFTKTREYYARRT